MKRNLFDYAMDLWVTKYDFNPEVSIESIMDELVKSGEYTKDDLDKVNHQFDLGIQAGIAYEEDIKEGARCIATL